MKSTAECISLLRKFKVEKASQYGIRRLGFFGSVARNEQSDNSDVDIYIECDSMSLLTLAHLKNMFESIFDCHVDVVRLRSNMNILLRKRIDKEGICV